MGILVRSTQVRDAVRPVLERAYAGEKMEPTAAAESAEVGAAKAEAEARRPQVDGRLLTGILLFLSFVIVAGMTTEYLKLPEWGGRLVTIFSVLWPFVFGYLGGEFVAEKTK